MFSFKSYSLTSSLTHTAYKCILQTLIISISRYSVAILIRHLFELLTEHLCM